MTPTDLRILCTALGFTAVVMQGGNSPKKEGNNRAKKLANLIEEFCRISVPDVFGVANVNLAADSDISKIDEAIDSFKTELTTKQDAHLPEDKATLCLFYSRLQARQAANQQKQFFAKATEDVIANHVLQMIDEEIEDSERE